MPIDKVRVMISSRCNDYPVAGGGSFPLKALRKTLKVQVDAAGLFKHGMLQCFTNEHEPAKAASSNLWEACLLEIRRSHIVLVLYSGDAGWSGEESEDGICHAELAEALYTGRDRTFIIQLPRTAKPPTARDLRFRTRFDKELQFTGAPTQTPDDVVALVQLTLSEAMANLVRGGAAMLRKQGYSLGEALDWSRLAYAQRKATMESACQAALADRGGVPQAVADGRYATLPVAGAQVLFCVHAVPAAMSLATAREMVGRPFLKDYVHMRAAPKAQGPVHVIACHRAATEKQATDLLGFPDATVVANTFGIYLVDPVQHIQLALLANCRDGATTRYAVQRFFDSLKRSGQDHALVSHARARASIVRAIQKAAGKAVPAHRPRAARRSAARQAGRPPASERIRRMIRIDRLPAPKAFLVAAKAGEDTAAAFFATALKRRQQTRFEFDDAAMLTRSVLARLDKQFNGKCAYCDVGCARASQSRVLRPRRPGKTQVKRYGRHPLGLRAVFNGLGPRRINNWVRVQELGGRCSGRKKGV